MMTDTPRLLFVYQFLGLGGVEVVLKGRLEAFAAMGIDARALFLSDAGGESLFTHLRDRTAVGGGESEWIRLLDEFRPHWILSIDTPSILTVARRHAPGAKLVYEVHTPYPEGQATLIDAHLLSGICGMLTPSASQRELVRALTSDRWPVRVVPNALPGSFSASAPGLFSTPGGPVVGWVGRLDSLKNWIAFIDLAEALRDRDVQFWMVGGDGSSSVQREALEQRIRESRLSSRLTWFPRVEYSDMPSFYRALASSGGCLVSTSWAESFGMTALEAAACGCPVVAPDVVGLRDIVANAKSGLTYPAGDTEAAAREVRALLDSGSLRRRLTRDAAKQLRGFTAAKSAAALLNALPQFGRKTARPAGGHRGSAIESRHLISAATISAQEIAHRDRVIRDLQAELAEKVGDRDRTIIGLQRELTEKVGDRDRLINDLQGEVVTKVHERDEVISRLQSEIEGRVGERDAVIKSQQAEMDRKVGERDSIITALQGELQTKVAAANEVIADLQRRIAEVAADRNFALQAELTEARSRAAEAAAERDRSLLDAEKRFREQIYAKDQEALAARAELQAAISSLQGELRQSEAHGREQQLMFEMRVREAQIDHERALLESEKQLASAIARREGEAASLREDIARLREDLARAIPKEELDRASAEAERLELELRASLEARRGLEEALSSAREEVSSVAAALAGERVASAEAELIRRSLQDEHTLLHAELASLRDELGGARRALQEQETLTDEIRDSLHAEASSVRLRLSNTQFELGMTRQELLAIYRSRLWKLGSAYWRGLQALGRLPRVAGTSSEDGWQHLPVACPSCGDTIKLLDLMMAAPPTAATVSEAALATALPVADGNVIALFPDAPVAPLAREDRFDVICFPIIDWDFRFQRPQQLMNQYAKAGHRVFYIAQRFRPSGRPFEIRRVRDSVYEVSLKAPKRNVYSSTMTRRDVDEFFASLDALRKEAGIHAAAAIVQLPFWWPLADRVRAQFGWPVVYDCMDHHHGFTGASREAVHEEKKLIRGADLVVVSSAFLQRQARKHTDKVIMIRNGCDFEHFAGRAAKPRMARPVIGYYGAIADWFDSDLVAELAARRPDWDFVLVGSSHLADVTRLEKLPNVRMTGEKSYSEIPEWLASFDVAIIPFKRTPLTEATNPVKCYEMLAGGKPVVAVPIPEVAQLAPFVRLASTAAEFEAEIQASLADTREEAGEERQRFARAHTWEERFSALEPAVRGCFPLASIVIVTYNNVDLNRQCLRSLYERTDWPRYEVFVVDNASTDGTREFLTEARLTYPNLQVILNDSNLGFPAANNQALLRASGDYVVLLNNDTVAARGSLSTLFRHLHREPKIGLIGPTTNAIGNEGMVEVGYRDVADMPAWAAQFVRGRDGEIFDIPMLAMFCVALRRGTFEKLGLLDENFGMGMFEDDDYSHRTRELKLRVVCARDSFVHHWMRAAFSKMPQTEYDTLFARNRKYYESKWGRQWKPHQRAQS